MERMDVHFATSVTLWSTVFIQNQYFVYLLRFWVTILAPNHSGWESHDSSITVLCLQTLIVLVLSVTPSSYFLWFQYVEKTDPTPVQYTSLWILPFYILLLNWYISTLCKTVIFFLLFILLYVHEEVNSNGNWLHVKSPIYCPSIL